MIDTPEYCIKNLTKNSSFHNLLFYNTAKSAPYELSSFYTQSLADIKPSFQQFIAVKLQSQPDFPGSSKTSLFQLGIVFPKSGGRTGV